MQPAGIGLDPHMKGKCVLDVKWIYAILPRILI